MPLISDKLMLSHLLYDLDIQYKYRINIIQRLSLRRLGINFIFFDNNSAPKVFIPHSPIIYYLFKLFICLDRVFLTLEYEVNYMLYFLHLELQLHSQLYKCIYIYIYKY